ncbi:MAG TPA: sialidase family protein, partial [Kofleriaceae bacterium]
GYCTAMCGVGHAACDGACVETRDGELCTKSCTSDRDCRTDEGYVCDRQWRACLVPNFAAIVPKQCPTQTGRALAFADSTAVSTPSTPGLAQRAPASVLADDGGLITAFTTSTPDGGGVLGISRLDATGARTTDQPFAPGRTTQVDGMLARDRKGNLIAVWHGVGESSHELGLATSTNRGATWSSPAIVHDAGDCAEAPRDCIDRALVAAGRDALHVLYATGESGLRVRTSRDGGKSFKTGPIVLGGTRGHAVVGSDNRLHVVAMTGGPLGGYGSALQQLEYTASGDGGATFTTPITVSGRDEVLPFYASNPTVAVDTARRWIYVAYARGGRDGAWEIVLATSKDAGTTWKRTKLAGDGCAIHMVPNLALDAATGTLHVAYYDSAGAPGRFVHASCAPGATKCKLHGAINSVPFAALSTGRHSSKWVGEYQSLGFDDKRRVLHAVWAQPVDESGKLVTRIFHAQAKLKK